MTLGQKIALFKLVVAVIAAIQRGRWYGEAREAIYAELDQEQKQRIEAAEAARRDHDAFADGGVLDPRQRD